MLDLQAEQHDRGQGCGELYEAVLQLKHRHNLHPCSVQPRDGLSLRRDSEREVVQELVKRFRDLPVDQQRRLPALLNSLGQLEIVVGDLEAGQRDFQEVAHLVADPLSQAEAQHNIYRAALERRDWNAALAALRRAVALDSSHFEPFPFSVYEPERILGAGGFGVSFLCRQRGNQRLVVVKALRTDSLDRSPAMLFLEMISLQDLDHPALVRIHGWAYAEGEESRPYLVMDYAPGQTLAEYVARHGTFSPDEWLPIAWTLARALQAIHGRGILHRSLRPAAVILDSPKKAEREEPEDSAPSTPPNCRVTLLDTGLSLKRALIHACASNPETATQTGLGRAVARTLAFAPVEVVGRPKGQVWVGPHSDIYSFGKLCAFALTGRANPDGGDLLLVPDAWRQLIDDCTAWTMGARLEHFGIVLERLSKLPGGDERLGGIERELYERRIDEQTALLQSDPHDVAVLIRRGNSHARQGDLEKAIADFSQAIEQRPNDAALYRRRALAHTRNHDFDATIADYTESLRLEPRGVEAFANRALAYAQKMDHEHAIADFNEALRLQPRDAVLLFNRGNAYFGKGDYALALADYTEVIRLDPRNLWAFSNRGKLYALLHDHTRAVADFTRVLQLDPNNVRALIDRAAAYKARNQPEQALADYTTALNLEPSAELFEERGLTYIAANDLDAAIADLDEAISLSPQHSGFYLLRANAQADKGDYEKAFADFDEALRLEPNLASGWFQRGTLHARRGELDAALADYAHALELDPDYTPAYFQRGNIHAERGEWQAALEAYSSALQRSPSDAASYTNRGNVYHEIGDHELALADYTAALKLDPADALTLCNRANTYARLRDYEHALADFTEAIRYDPANARALNNRANVHLELGNADAALADYTQAIKVDPAYARSYHNRGNLLGERGRLDEALADLNEAIRLEPEYAPAFYNRGNVHVERGEWDRAITDFTEALRLHPNHAGALNNRGNAHRRKGDLEAALADFTAALAAAPGSLLPLCNRANIYAEKGDYAVALADYTEALRLQPNDVMLHHNRGRIHALSGNVQEAIADNLEALRLRPDDARTYNNLAWLWATATPPELRDPARAVEYARRACELTQGQDAGCLDTLAAAYAAAGQFAEAVQQQRLALERASESEKEDFRSRLESYEREHTARSTDTANPEGTANT
jgi:tetratricopeptide (TPR) repeat protein